MGENVLLLLIVLWNHLHHHPKTIRMVRFARENISSDQLSLSLSSGESTIGSKRVSDSGDDYVDLTLEALTLTNTKPSLKYVQIEPLELAYISMEEIIRVCFML